MRRHEREITDPAAIEDILRQGSICHLAMVDDGEPYVLPMNFGYSDGALFLHCAAAGRKLDVLRKNPRVCFAVETDVAMLIDPEVACNGSARYRSVVGMGTAQIIEDPDAMARALDVLMAQAGGPTGPYPADSLRNMRIIRIDIESMTGKQARQA